MSVVAHFSLPVTGFLNDQLHNFIVAQQICQQLLWQQNEPVWKGTYNTGQTMTKTVAQLEEANNSMSNNIAIPMETVLETKMHKFN